MTSGGQVPDQYFEGSFPINAHYDFGTAGSTTALNDSSIFSKIPWIYVYCEEPFNSTAPY